MPRYVMDLFRGDRLMVGRAFDAPDDAAAVAQAGAVFLANTADDARITGYRLRSPMPGSDRIFHTEYVSARPRW